MSQPTINISSIQHFEKSLKALAKHFRQVTKEVKNLVLQLESGEVVGDKVPNLGYDVYKVRLANPDAQRGKSGGFRIIYYIHTLERILLLDIYSKTDQENVTTLDILSWIQEAEDEFGDDDLSDNN
jgi:mRNA-degrading endonuclease RelE of RelBE toxin-antitoxin system